MVNFVHLRFNTLVMSFSFRLRYFLGLIPKAQKIDSAWFQLFKMRDELETIEASRELARYLELKQLLKSNDFQTKKREIINLGLKGSVENDILTELANLEKSKPIKNYFRFLQSSDFNRVNTISKSSDLSRYQELHKLVESPDFIRRKKECESLKYQDSHEYLKVKEFRALQKSSKLKLYNATLSSTEYRIFLELDTSGEEKLKNYSKELEQKEKIYHKFLKSKAYRNFVSVSELKLPAKFEQLKRETSDKAFLERVAFLKNSARYETTTDYPLFSEYKKLARSSDIQFYNKCVKSSLYLNFQEIAVSKSLSRLLELRLKVNEPSFIERVSFLKNKKRYETTPEFKLEMEFAELEKSKLITTYHQLKKRSELAFFNQWDIVLDENFSDHKLSPTLWEPENYWGSKLLGSSFSQANELQAYKGLKNIEFRNKVLSIVSKAEKTEGKVWNPSFGLIPKKFDFSSAIINTGNGFRFKEGIVEAKVKFRANKAITSSFSLTGNKPFPQIDVFRSGHKKVGLGIINQPGNSGADNFVQIRGLNFNHFHIFRLEIFGNQVVWKINNHEVHRQHLDSYEGDLFLNFTGSIHHANAEEILPHHFEIEWVRCLRKK